MTAPDLSVNRDFELWLSPHLTLLRRLARTLVQADLVDDLVQETSLRAWQKQHTYDPTRGDPRVWLAAILRDQARKQWRRGTIELLVTAVHEAAAPSTVDGDADGSLRAAIARLPTRQREMVILQYYVDLSHKQIAQFMGCSVGTVKSTVHDARVTLAQELTT